MRSTFAGFDASKSALFATQKALDIVGNNLSNISTEGYTRQRADQVSVTLAGYQTRYKESQVNAAGMGTEVKGIAQLRDERLDTAFRKEFAQTGYFSQSSSMLGEIEGALQELDVGKDGNGYGLSYHIKSMYTALENLSNNAGSATDANVFASSVSQIATLLNESAKTLTDTANQYKSELQTNVTDVNSMLQEVANLNKSIRNCLVGAGYTEQYGPNELKDHRNLLLDQLSAYGGLTVEDQPDGTVTVSMNGHTCVKGTEHDQVNYQENTNGTVQLNWKSDGEDAASGVGSFKATTDILNGRGLNALSNTESNACGFLFYQDKLDTFAQTLTDVLNNTIPASFDQNGKVTAYRKLVGESLPDDEGKYQVFSDMRVTADNIAVTDALFSDPSYVVYDKESTDNSYVLQLIDKLANQEHNFASGTENFHGTFQQFVADYTGTLGGDVSYAQNRYEASYSIVSETLENRDSVSGVNETEETVSMMMYNKAFQAAARMMTTMDDMLDVIINRMAV